MNDRLRLFATALLAAVTVLLPAGVHAAGCRKGDDALADERALETVRNALAQECPCNSFSTHDAYYTCAFRQLALVGGSLLRPECVQDALDLIGGAVCGTGGVACASVTRDRPPRVSCQVTAPSACRATNARPRPGPPISLFPESAVSPRRAISPFIGVSSSRRACDEQTFCADVVEWTAGTCVDTRSDGPYAAGFRDVRLVKPSAVDPTQERVLNAVIWYPTTPGAGPIETGSRAVRDAPLDLSGGPYPVVMFSHGSCGFERQSLFLTPWLATHGFIVVAPPHPGNTLFEFPTCGTGPAQAASAVERPRDIIFALDYILAQGKDPASPFYGAVDESRIAMTGHSFGGLTTYLTTALDDRFTVALPMAPATGPNSTLTIPSMTMYGAIDSVVSIPGVLAAYDRSSAPKRLVEIDDAGHYAFSDSCFPAPECNPPVTLTQDEAHERVKRQVLPFLEVYLAGDQSFAPFLTTAPPPGVQVSSK